MMLTKHKGQGLVETMITLVVIVVGVIALLRFQNYLSYSNTLTQQQSDATTLAANKIESLRDFTALTGTGSYETIASGTSTSTGINTTFTLTWTITTNTNPNYKLINVNVTWNDIRGNAQSIQLVSQVAGIDPNNSGQIM